MTDKPTVVASKDHEANALAILKQVDETYTVDESIALAQVYATLAVAAELRAARFAQ